MSVRDDCTYGCGSVSFEVEDLTVRVCIDTNEATYLYRCPECRMVVTRDVHRSLRELLINSGARVESWFLPSELFEPHDGPPISVDDVIDFHQALNA